MGFSLTPYFLTLGLPCPILTFLHHIIPMDLLLPSLGSFRPICFPQDPLVFLWAYDPLFLPFRFNGFSLNLANFFLPILLGFFLLLGFSKMSINTTHAHTHTHTHTHSLSLCVQFLYFLSSLSPSLLPFTLFHSLFFSSVINGYQQRLNASNNDRQNQTIHSVHEATIDFIPTPKSFLSNHFSIHPRRSLSLHFKNEILNKWSWRRMRRAY